MRRAPQIVSRGTRQLESLTVRHSESTLKQTEIVNPNLVRSASAQLLASCGKSLQG